MFLLERWKAILAWSAICLIMGKGLLWLMNLTSPKAPEWTIFFVFLVYAVIGACYITQTR